MRLCVGVSGTYRAGWKEILRQEGIPAVDVHRGSEKGECSALILGDGSDRHIVEAAGRFLKNGGSVLCTGEMFGVLSGKAAKKVPVKYLLEEAVPPFAGIGLVDLYTHCHLPGGANAVRTDAGTYSVYSGELNGGTVVALPLDAGKLMRDARTATKSFYASRRRLPFERVSLVSRGGLRRLVGKALESLHHAQGVPYVHRWCVPGEQRSIFTWRIDTDAAGCGEIERVADFVHGRDIRATWFVDVGAQRDCLPRYSAMASDEVGIHCFDHVVHRRGADCLADIRRAADELLRAGLHPRSYAAPYGHWSPEVGEAIATSGVEFSSEFSYDYDNLPSSPPVAGGDAGVLQVPIHPISIGSLRRQGFGEREMINYYDDILESKIAAGEPLSLYYHPHDGCEAVVGHIFDAVHRHHLVPVPMIEYARWWNARSAAGPVPELSGSSLRIRGDIPPDVRLHLTQFDGREAFVPLQREINLEAVTWSERPAPRQLAEDILRTRRFNPWIPVVRVEDFLFAKRRMGREEARP